MNKKPILIINGEPFSVFLEIFFKALKLKKYKNPIIIIASKNLLLSQMKKLKYNFKINLLNKKNINLKKLNNNSINIINVNFKFKKPFDKLSDNSNIYIEKCFKIALQLIKEHTLSGLINGPISKKNFLKKNYLGITEYLAEKTKKRDKVAMLIYNKKLSVSPITTHLPLKLVSKNLSKKKIINQAKLIKLFYKKNFNINPKIGVAGLNPHCESNYKSSEEKNIIIPAIRYLTKKKYKIYGPFSADTIFMRDNIKKFDCIIGMYHDQVLTPIKTLFNFDAINITLGLHFVRISPDHGPNTTMIGKNLSNPKSLIQAINFLDK
jgi:4-hydroxythreonine-4-phosphate dehydrogenase